MKEFLGDLELNRTHHMDCLEGMKLIPDKSIDMILCDLPYGTTQCKWDTIIPFEPLWGQYERIIKDDGAIVLTASQPFTSALIMSNANLFRYEIIWKKNNITNFWFVKKQIGKCHENICVFYKKQPVYNPQMTQGKPYKKTNHRRTENTQGERVTEKKEINNKGVRYPKSVLEFANEAKKGSVHPTQKPVALFEYLIKTYTNENDIVLDNCIGSGTTAVACELNNRKWIGFETEQKYIDITNKRLEELKKQ
jgi:site-specific DNA-methyltransferase (adenine-specific)